MHLGGATQQVGFTPRLVSADPDLLLAAALAGHGVCRLATFLAEPHLRSGRLVPVLDGHVAERHEVALAKAELKDDVTKAGVGAGLLAGAAFLGLIAFILLCIAAALGLEALGLPGWAAFLVVTGVLLLLAGILALVGKKRLQSVQAPERTIETAKGSVAALKGRR